MTAFLKYVQAEAEYNLAVGKINSGIEVSNIDALEEAYLTAKADLEGSGHTFVGEPVNVVVAAPSVLPVKVVVTTPTEVAQAETEKPLPAEKKTTPTK